jgi:hypothetical protein
MFRVKNIFLKRTNKWTTNHSVPLFVVEKVFDPTSVIDNANRHERTSALTNRHCPHLHGQVTVVTAQRPALRKAIPRCETIGLKITKVVRESITIRVALWSDLVKFHLTVDGLAEDAAGLAQMVPR